MHELAVHEVPEARAQACDDGLGQHEDHHVPRVDGGNGARVGVRAIDGDDRGDLQQHRDALRDEAREGHQLEAHGDRLQGL